MQFTSNYFVEPTTPNIFDILMATLYQIFHFIFGSGPLKVSMMISSVAFELAGYVNRMIWFLSPHDYHPPLLARPVEVGMSKIMVPYPMQVEGRHRYACPAVSANVYVRNHPGLICTSWFSCLFDHRRALDPEEQEAGSKPSGIFRISTRINCPRPVLRITVFSCCSKHNHSYGDAYCWYDVTRRY